MVPTGTRVSTFDIRKDEPALISTSTEEQALVLSPLAGDGEPTVVLNLYPHFARNPRWSPDGSALVFVRFGTGQRPAVWRMFADLSHEAALLIPSAHFADWSPDGARLVYEGEDEAAFVIDLWVYDFDSKATHPLFDEHAVQRLSLETLPWE
jgi:Tol biopolymer transport system component